MGEGEAMTLARRAQPMGVARPRIRLAGRELARIACEQLAIRPDEITDNEEMLAIVCLSLAARVSVLEQKQRARR